jgi:hypothetical protein
MVAWLPKGCWLSESVRHASVRNQTLQMRRGGKLTRWAGDVARQASISLPGEMSRLNQPERVFYPARPFAGPKCQRVTTEVEVFHEEFRSEVATFPQK